MCGRYVRKSDKQRLAEAFHLRTVPDSIALAPNYNVAPTTFQPVIRCHLLGIVGAEQVNRRVFGIVACEPNELRDPDVARSPTTIDNYFDYFDSRIRPRWRDVALDDVKAVAVEKWLRSLVNLAPGTKAKIRNHLSALFSHAIRHELFFPRAGINPIANVRQGAKRLREQDTLTLSEISEILSRIKPQAIKVMVIVAAASGLRRSEIRGLKWLNCDFKNKLFLLRQGVVRKHQTKLKTEASRRSMPMSPELAQALLEWRNLTPYNQDDDWVFASPYTNGKRPYWAESALANHIRPAAEQAKITKIVGWHTFRHSLASLLGDKKEDRKIVQEIMGHASSRMASFSALRYPWQPLLHPYRTHDLCPVDLCLTSSRNSFRAIADAAVKRTPILVTD
jgi:integrase